MSTQIMLAIIGISATLIVGVLAIFITVRFNKKVQIKFIYDQCISLLEEITKNIPELKISYKDEAIDQNIVLLKGYLINTGKKDISPDMVEERLSLNLPEGFECLDCEITETQGIKVKVLEVKKRKIVFEFGLWKTKEYYKFDTLVKVITSKKNTPKPPNRQLLGKMIFTHRITDMYKIEKERLPGKSNKFVNISPIIKYIQKLGFIFPFIFILAGIIFCFANYLPFSKQDVIGYSYEYNGNVYKLYQKVDGDEIRLTNNKDFSKIYNLDELNKLDKKVILLPNKTMDIAFQIIGIAYIIMGLFLLFFNFLEKYRENKILRIVNK